MTDTDNAGSAIGSTEPTVEDAAHYTPEMQALAERDGSELICRGCGVNFADPENFCRDCHDEWSMLPYGTLNQFIKRG